jgi:hypothetical protein
MLSLSAAVGACETTSPANVDASQTDAAVIDTPLADADFINFSFTGRYLDWDATDSAPCGIAGATWTVKYDASRVATTNAAGAFTIPLTNYYSLLDIKPPSTASACTTPPSEYTIPGIAVAPPAVVLRGVDYVARSLTTARVATFYAQIGTAFDATRAGLLVHVVGPERAISISAPHAPAQRFANGSWSTGMTGADVYFPNIEVPAQSVTIVTVDGGALGTGSVPLAAGAITYMTVIVE